MDNRLCDGLAEIEKYRTAINDEMAALISSDDEHLNGIVEAMRYSALGGKRIRGIMVMAFADMLGADYNTALRLACALECIQAYSLIHDDLPCMDDDDMRRGKPACHIAFGEATAVLAGDALLTYAFELAAGASPCSPQEKCDAIASLAGYAGFRGMVGGQVMDVDTTKGIVSPEKLNEIQRLKTAALFRASAALGCCAAAASDEDREDADNFALSFGLAFQIADDISDSKLSAKHEINSHVTVNGIEKSLNDEEYLIALAEDSLSRLAARGCHTATLRTMLTLIGNNN